MNSALFSTLDLWENHIRSVLLRRYTHLTAQNLPDGLLARLTDPLMEIPIHYAARCCGRTQGDLLRNLFAMSVQSVFEALQPEQMTLLNEDEPVTFQIQSPHATGHFLRFCTRLRQSKAPSFSLLRLAMHYASLYQLAIESGAAQLVLNPLGFDKASFRAQSALFAQRVHDAIGVMPAKGTHLDLLAEAMGYENGFQQFKPILPSPERRSRPHGVLFRGARTSAEDWLERLLPTYQAENPDWLTAFVRLRDELRIETNAVGAGTWSLIYRGLLPVLLSPPADMDANTQTWFKKALARYMPQILAHLQPQVPDAPGRPSCPDTAVWDAAVRVSAQFQSSHRAQDVVDAYSHGDDGFELAKALERHHGWDFQREDIDTLDEVGDLVESREAAAGWFWLQIFGVEPPFPIGATIREGVIDGICDYQPAHYLVKPPLSVDTEHSRSRRLIAFENARLATPASQVKFSDNTEKVTIRSDAG